MMDSVPPPQLWILFASKAPIAVIVREGPRKWSHLILWHTNTDTFEPGQWLKGRLEYASLSSDGRHMAMAVKATGKRVAETGKSEYTLVSRPPYFTALAISFHFFVRGNNVVFEDDELVWETGGTIALPAGTCTLYPIKTKALRESTPETTPAVWRKKSLDGIWQSPQGRKVQVKEGKLYDLMNNESRLLFDANPYQPTPVETPEWAKTWNAEPPTIRTAS